MRSDLFHGRFQHVLGSREWSVSGRNYPQYCSSVNWPVMHRTTIVIASCSLEGTKQGAVYITLEELAFMGSTISYPECDVQIAFLQVVIVSRVRNTVCPMFAWVLVPIKLVNPRPYCIASGCKLWAHMMKYFSRNESRCQEEEFHPSIFFDVLFSLSNREFFCCTEKHFFV